MHITSEQALSKLSRHDKAFIKLFAHGSLTVEVYRPHKVDLQTPYEQDEIYVIVAGTGNFYCEGHTVPFAAGDFLFVPAGAEHRFENFSADFATWVFFYGPQGGES